MELDRLRRIISEILHVDQKEVMPETSFVSDLGADSLDLYQIAGLIQDEFGVPFTVSDFNSSTVVADVIREIQEKERA